LLEKEVLDHETLMSSMNEPSEAPDPSSATPSDERSTERGDSKRWALA
jgi:hypothetical protein